MMCIIYIHAQGLEIVNKASDFYITQHSKFIRQGSFKFKTKWKYNSH